MTAKTLAAFHILVKLHLGSLQLKNELIRRHFAAFCQGLTKCPWQHL